MPNGKYSFTPKEVLEGEPSIIIVDEVSMLPKNLWNLLCSHNVYIIALGDPMQLPPIEKDQNNGILEHPHIFLDEVMRQAQESEIIRLSMHVREGKPLYTFPKSNINQEVMIIRPFEVTDGMMLWADQIICATNNTRKNLNFHVRKILEYPEEHPVEGDKVINLHNEWETLSSYNNPLTNGVIGQIKKYETINYAYPYALRRKPTCINLLKMDITGDEVNETFSGLVADYNELLTGVPSFSGKEEYLLQRRYKKEPFPLHFNYGYAITCWKAQGSEWNKILGYEENFPYTAEEHTKYLYTLITRAQNRLVLVRA